MTTADCTCPVPLRGTGRHLVRCPQISITKELICPHCGRVNDTHTSPNQDPPQPGDVGICFKCHGLAVLTPFGFLRPPRDEAEARELEGDPNIKRARAAMSEAYTPSQALRLLKEGQ